LENGNWRLKLKFAFEKLDVYQQALHWVERVENLCEQLKGQVSRILLEQLTRASVSIPLNIAEGNGRWHKGDKRQFFWIARGSVFECVPIIQVLHRKKLIEEKRYIDCYEHLEIMAKMLTKLVKSVEDLQADK
jgi:four helix bundle protein